MAISVTSNLGGGTNTLPAGAQASVSSNGRTYTIQFVDSANGRTLTAVGTSEEIRKFIRDLQGAIGD